MKKVRFVDSRPDKCFRLSMEDSECHSPRPFIEKLEPSRQQLCYEYPKLLPYHPDPVQRFECTNSSPYPLLEKTCVENVCDPKPRWPSKDLELSMLDSSHCEPRQPILSKQQTFGNASTELIFKSANDRNKYGNLTNYAPKVLASIENINVRSASHPESNNFFIKRDNLNNMYAGHINSLQSQLNRLSLPKENDPLARKAELMRVEAQYEPSAVKIQPKIVNPPIVPVSTVPDECRCHHCVKTVQNSQCNLVKETTSNLQKTYNAVEGFPLGQQCACMQAKSQHVCPCSHPKVIKPTSSSCSCQKTEILAQIPHNAVDKKTWMIEKYEQNKKQDGMEVEKQNAASKEKREPTVSDLFKIIKLQNEQLQLLQEKVDKFISAGNRPIAAPIQNYVAEHVALETVDNEQHKISIGVMTSFEMVRTSTVINKEIITQTNENAQIQCNRSQISIKEVVSKSQPVTLNFLDGIVPAGRSAPLCSEDKAQSTSFCGTMQPAENVYDDKTLNELSLYNVQVDNPTTPYISPEQSLYLDIRDYSDSESGSDDQSNVGWTYYNKVMTHVNGVLQESDMPSSASALFRNTKQQCVQMQIDKTNVSVTKRVKFGDDPLGIHQPHLYAATDTSLKMNQLAAKYLKGGALSPSPLQVPIMSKPSAMPIEMSFATRNYMERHRILQGITMPSRSPTTGEIPRFLDITALKQQPKLL